jgi:hypothetical protein
LFSRGQVGLQVVERVLQARIFLYYGLNKTQGFWQLLTNLAGINPGQSTGGVQTCALRSVVPVGSCGTARVRLGAHRLIKQTNEKHK